MHWCFGPFRLDLANAALWQAEQPVPLRPKTFAVLVYLVTHAGQLVTKDALFDAVWPETAVGDGVLKTSMGELRKTLGKTGKASPWIATVHGRGYRFVASVTRAEPASPGEVPAARVALQPAHPPIPGRVSMPAARLVAREAEVTTLHQWYAKALQGERHLGFITGEAGIGKTTLVDTVVAQLAAQESLWIGHGQCIEQYGAGEAYLPLLEVLGQLGRTPDGPDFVALLRQHAPSWLLQLPALLPTAEYAALQQAAGGNTRERMLRELAEAMEVLTTVHPCILVLEDLHWSDTATIEWLAYVARRRGPARLLVLGTYRPVETMVRAHPVRAMVQELVVHRQGAELPLGEWAESGVAAYLAQRGLGVAAPAALVQVLTERTDGHPLFLVAVVDALVQQGVLRVGPTGWELVGGLDAVRVGIPPSVRHVLEQQMAQLQPAEQALLAAASVAGVEFAVAAAAAAVQQAEEEVEVQCDALASQHHVVQACGTALWPDGTVTARYRFRHALYQALLYERVPGNRRRRWHQQIGRRLEAGYGPQAREIAAELGMHFGRGQEASRAVWYLQQAGEKALEQSAYREAVGSFEQALQALVYLPEHGDTSVRALELRLALGRTLIELGEYGRSLTLLGEAEVLARALDDRPRQGQVLSWTSIARRITGDPEGAMAAGQQAIELAAALGECILQAQACLDLGQACNAIGAFGRAAEWLQQSVEAADRVAGPSGTDLRIRSRVWLAQTVSALGAFAEGRRYGEEALRLAMLEGRGEIPIVVHTQLGTLSLIKGDLEHTIQVFDQGLTRCRACENQNQLPVIAGGLGAAYALQGRLAEGRALLEEAISESLRTGAVRGLADRVAWLSEACRLAGHHEEAWQHARQALDLARQQQARGGEVHALHQLGAVHASATPPQVAQAVAYYQQALVLAEELGMRPLQAHCHRSLGMLYAATSQCEQAKTTLSTAVEMYQGMDMTFWLPQTEAVLAQVAAP